MGIRTRVAWMLAVAFGLRMGLALAQPPEMVFADSRDYHAVARNLLAGKGFLDSLGRRGARAPGYPLFLAGCYAMFGERPAAAQAAQCLLGAGVCGLVLLLGRRIFDARTGELAGWTAAVYPFLAAYSGLLLSEAVFIPLLVAAVALLERPWTVSVGDLPPEDRRGPWLWACGAGAVMGVAILTRSSLLLFPFFCLPFWLVCSRRRAAGLGYWAAATAVALAVQTPWVGRNFRVFGRFVPTTLMVGESLLEANGPGADGGPRIDRMAEVRDPEIESLGEYERDRLFRDAALRWMRENPGRFALLAVEKQRRFWNLVPNAREYRTPLHCAASLATYGPVLALAVLGVVCAGGAWRRAALLLIPVLYYAGLHAVFVGSTRYRAPVEPFLMVFSAWGFWRLWDRAAGRGRTAVQRAADATTGGA